MFIKSNYKFIENLKHTNPCFENNAIYAMHLLEWVLNKIKNDENKTSDSNSLVGNVPTNELYTDLIRVYYVYIYYCLFFAVFYFFPSANNICSIEYEFCHQCQ